MQIERKTWPALVLNGVAGFVDVVGYVTLRQVFTANMTGNTLAVAHSIAVGDVGYASRRGFVIPVFVAGMIVSRLVVHRAGRRGEATPAWRLYGMEAALLAAMVLVGERAIQGHHLPTAPPGLYYLLVALPAAAMGLQNAALTRFGPLTVRTTHVTGTLAELSESAVRYLVWLRDETRSRSWGRVREALAASPRQRSLRKAALLGGVWLAYAAGGVAGALLLEAVALWSLGLPIAALLLVAAIDWRPAAPPRGHRGAREEAGGEGERPRRGARAAPPLRAIRGALRADTSRCRSTSGIRVAAMDGHAHLADRHRLRLAGRRGHLGLDRRRRDPLRAPPVHVDHGRRLAGDGAVVRTARPLGLPPLGPRGDSAGRRRGAAARRGAAEQAAALSRARRQGNDPLRERLHGGGHHRRGGRGGGAVHPPRPPDVRHLDLTPMWLRTSSGSVSSTSRSSRCAGSP